MFFCSVERGNLKSIFFLWRGTYAMKTLIILPVVHLLATRNQRYHAENGPNEYRSAPADAYVITAGETGLG